MSEKRGFGKNNRNEGYKPYGKSGKASNAFGVSKGASRGGRSSDTRGTDNGASRGTSYGASRSADNGASRGLNNGASRGPNAGASRGSSYGASRGPNTGASRGSNYGATRGPNAGASHSSNYGAIRSAEGDSSVNFRSKKPMDTEVESRSTDFRGNRSRSQEGGSYGKARTQEGGSYGKARTQEGGYGKARGQDDGGFNRNRSQDASVYREGFKSAQSQDFEANTFHGDEKESEYVRKDRINDQKDSQSKPNGMKDRNITREEQNFELESDLDKLEGRNSVLEALKAGRSINRIFVAKGDRDGSISQIIAIARQNHILIQEIDRAKLDSMSVTHSHQGVIALTAAKDYVEVEDILKIAAASGRLPFIIILDEITDSYNLGSILRTANAAGVHGVIIPKRRAVGLTSAVSKASAGAIEYVPVARVTNIVQTIENLKKQNIWVVGTDSTGEESYFDKDLTGSIALVIGSEGEGMGKLVRESCDFIVNIPMKGQISSLNAAVAGAIVTYEILRQRSKK